MIKYKLLELLAVLKISNFLGHFCENKLATGPIYIIIS